VKEEVFAACFTTEETKILTSDGSGTITVSETISIVVPSISVYSGAR
jgi:hypothetical protein